MAILSYFDIIAQVSNLSYILPVNIMLPKVLGIVYIYTREPTTEISWPFGLSRSETPG